LTIYPEQLVIQLFNYAPLDQGITAGLYLLLIFLLRKITGKILENTLIKLVANKILIQDLAKNEVQKSKIDNIYQMTRKVIIIVMMAIFLGDYLFRPRLDQIVVLILKIFLLVIVIFSVVWYTWQFIKTKRLLETYKDENNLPKVQRKMIDSLIKQLWMSFFLPQFLFIPFMLLLFEIQIG